MRGIQRGKGARKRESDVPARSPSREMSPVNAYERERHIQCRLDTECESGESGGRPVLMLLTRKRAPGGYFAGCHALPINNRGRRLREGYTSRPPISLL